MIPFVSPSYSLPDSLFVQTHYFRSFTNWLHKKETVFVPFPVRGYPVFKVISDLITKDKISPDLMNAVLLLAALRRLGGKPCCETWDDPFSFHKENKSIILKMTFDKTLEVKTELTFDLQEALEALQKHRDQINKNVLTLIKYICPVQSEWTCVCRGTLFQGIDPQITQWEACGKELLQSNFIEQKVMGCFILETLVAYFDHPIDYTAVLMVCPLILATRELTEVKMFLNTWSAIFEKQEEHVPVISVNNWQDSDQWAHAIYKSFKEHISSMADSNNKKPMLEQFLTDFAQRYRLS